jgi:hypothetical protein
MTYSFNRDYPLDKNLPKKPFVVSLSNHELPFDKLRACPVLDTGANGSLANGQSRFNNDKNIQSHDTCLDSRLRGNDDDNK